MRSTCSFRSSGRDSMGVILLTDKCQGRVSRALFILILCVSCVYRYYKISQKNIFRFFSVGSRVPRDWIVGSFCKIWALVYTVFKTHPKWWSMVKVSHCRPWVDPFISLSQNSQTLNTCNSRDIRHYSKTDENIEKSIITAETVAHLESPNGRILICAPTGMWGRKDKSIYSKFIILLESWMKYRGTHIGFPTKWRNPARDSRIFW